MLLDSVGEETGRKLVGRTERELERAEEGERGSCMVFQKCGTIFAKWFCKEIFKKSIQISLSRTQAGPGRAVKQEQEEISPNHVQTF